MPLYECPKCGRTVEKTYPGKYFCAVCGPEAIMKPLEAKRPLPPWESPATEALKILKTHPAMDAVWHVLDMDRTLTATAKNVLWQDFVAAWNRRRLITNEQAEMLTKHLRW